MESKFCLAPTCAAGRTFRACAGSFSGGKIEGLLRALTLPVMLQGLKHFAVEARAEFAAAHRSGAGFGDIGGANAARE